MKNEDLKKYLGSLPVPEPDGEAKERTIRSAVAELRREAGERQKNVKGSSWFGRLMGKLTKGEPIMQRPIAITSGIAAGCIALAIALSPVFVSQRAVRMKPSEVQIDAGKRDQIPAAPSSDSNIQDEFPAEEIQLNASDLKDMEFVLLEKQPELEQAMPQKRFNMSDSLFMSAYSGTAPGSSGPAMGRPVDQTHVGRDQFDTITSNPVKLVSEAPVSTFSIDVDTASYAFVRRALNSGYLPQKNAVRIEEMINYFDYDYFLPPDRSAPFKPSVAVFPTPWNADTRLLHIGIKGYDIVSSETMSYPLMPM